MGAPGQLDLAGATDRLKAAYARRSPRDARYSWFQPGHLFLMQQRERAVLAALARHGLDRLDDLRVLEIGCGNANWLRDLVRWGARAEHLTGVDLLPERVRAAVALAPPGLRLACASGAALPFPDGAFDLVLQSTVFTSVLEDELKRRIATEMLRVLRPGGRVLWYDYHVNNPANPDVRAVPKAEIRRLFPGCRIDLRRVTLVPPLARRLAARSWLACLLLEKIPLLRTHYLGMIVKPSA